MQNKVITAHMRMVREAADLAADLLQAAGVQWAPAAIQKVDAAIKGGRRTISAASLATYVWGPKVDEKGVPYTPANRAAQKREVLRLMERFEIEFEDNIIQKLNETE